MIKRLMASSLAISSLAFSGITQVDFFHYKASYKNAVG